MVAPTLITGQGGGGRGPASPSPPEFCEPRRHGVTLPGGLRIQDDLVADVGTTGQEPFDVFERRDDAPDRAVEAVHDGGEAPGDSRRATSSPASAARESNSKSRPP